MTLDEALCSDKISNKMGHLFGLQSDKIFKFRILQPRKKIFYLKFWKWQICNEINKNKISRFPSFWNNKEYFQRSLSWNITSKNMLTERNKVFNNEFTFFVSCFDSPLIPTQPLMSSWKCKSLKLFHWFVAIKHEVLHYFEMGTIKNYYPFQNQ